MAENTGSNPLDRTSEHLGLVLEAGRMGTWIWDVATGAVHWDEAMEARYGLAPGTFGGTFEAFLELVHPEDREWVTHAIERARDAGVDLGFEHRAVWPDGSVHWLEGRGRPVFGDDGALTGLVGIGLDVDERKQLELAIEDAVALRATAALVHQLENAERIAKVGSWYWDATRNEVTLSRQMERLLACTGPLTGEQFREALLVLSHPDDTGLLVEGPRRALQDRRPYVVEQRLVDGGDERIVVHRGEILEADDGDLLGIRGTTQDVTEERRAEAALLATTESLMRERRAVQVLHEALIRSEFPPVDGFDFAARYLAPADVPDVGGDWYDVFAVPDGRVLLAIGDVSGHGIRAARLMAKLRHSTRAYSCIDSDLDYLLDRLDDFLVHFSEPGEFATIQLGLLDPPSGTLELASAGHPPPLYVAGGRARFVEMQPRPVAGLGMHPAGDAVLKVELEPGAALLFYTDGLVEKRTQIIDEGMARLARSAGNARIRNAEDLVAAAIAGCVDATRSDDVCVLALMRSR